MGQRGQLSAHAHVNAHESNVRVERQCNAHKCTHVLWQQHALQQHVRASSAEQRTTPTPTPATATATATSSQSAKVQLVHGLLSVEGGPRRRRRSGRSSCCQLLLVDYEQHVQPAGQLERQPAAPELHQQSEQCAEHAPVVAGQHCLHHQLLHVAVRLTRRRFQQQVKHVSDTGGKRLRFTLPRHERVGLLACRAP